MFMNRLFLSGNLFGKRFLGKNLSGKKLLIGDEIIISKSRLPPKLFYNQFRSKRGKLKLIELDENEISYRQFAAASRSGGQKMNRKATAVELRYAPTGTIVWCQDKRTPEQNYELALLNLRKARPILQILTRKIRLRNLN